MWLSRFLLSTQKSRRTHCTVLPILEFLFTLGRCLSTHLCSVFDEISSSCSSHHWYQSGIFWILFLSLFNYALFTYWAFFTIFLWLEGLFMIFFCRNSLLYSLILYSGDFARLGPVVFVPLIGGFHVKNWCVLLSRVFILLLSEDCRMLHFTWFFQVENILFYKHMIWVTFPLCSHAFPIK